jgi:F-type H+-transporting ATPase subunit delta
MAELATIARPYAEALFRVATSGNATPGAGAAADHGGDLASWSALLHELAGAAGHPEILSLASSPKVGRQQVSDLILSLVQAPVSAAAGEQVKNLLRMLVANHRLALLPQIVQQFDALKNADAGAADVEIASAFPLEGAALDELLVSLERKFGRKLNASVTVDKSLIGGVRVTVGDEVLDTSVRARLANMQTVLAA